MENYKKKYIKNVKSFFPIMGKREKEYLSNLSIDVKNSSSQSLDELYLEFGSPKEVSISYFNTIDTEEMIKRINSKKIIQRILLAIFILIFISLVISCFILYQNHITFQREQIFSEDTIIN